ncbi:MAG: D-alanine--D-alanine ligase [Pseudomonadota bacterium]
MTRVTDVQRFGKVAVLFGGDSAEREVSLQSGRAVHTALRARGVDAHLVDTQTVRLPDLPAHHYDRCWNALHGGAGEDGTVAAVLSVLGLPVTGSGMLASALAMDKERSKKVLAQSGVPVPQTIALNSAVPPAESVYPLFVKPVDGGSSIAARPVQSVSDWADAYASAAAAGNGVLVEPLLSGPEYTVGVLQGQVLPAIRIEVASEFYDFDAKYVSDTTRFICPGVEDEALAARIADIALRSFDALGCSGWGRVDLMMTAGGEPLVLEVNTVPGMTSHSLVPCAAKVAGIDFETLCWRILETSFLSGEANDE